MDYDKSDIAGIYDEARSLTPARQRRWRDLLATHVDRSAIFSRVVGLGCGTGRLSEILAAEFGARIIGFDPSENMIDQARRQPVTVSYATRWTCGSEPSLNVTPSLLVMTGRLDATFKTSRFPASINSSLVTSTWAARRGRLIRLGARAPAYSLSARRRKRGEDR